MTTLSITQTGLLVKPKSEVDKLLIDSIISSEGFYAEFDNEFNCFTFPETMNCYDELERQLQHLFNSNDINANIEGIWPIEDNNEDEDNDVDPAGGHGLYSHE